MCCCVCVCGTERERKIEEGIAHCNPVLMHVMWGAMLLPLLNRINDINKLFTKWGRTSVFCFTSPPHLSIFVSLCLPHCPPFHSFLPSLIPNQRDDPRKCPGAEYEWAQLPCVDYWPLSMNKFTQTQACSEKTKRVNIEGYASTYASAWTAFADTCILQTYVIPQIYLTHACPHTHKHTHTYEWKRHMFRL